MNDIVYTKMTYNEYYTGVSLVNSALSYKDGVLVVDKDKILGEVEKAESSMIAEVWKLQGGASQQNVQDIKSKYGTSSISGNDPIPKNDNYVKYAVNDDEIPKKIYGDNFKESKTPEVKISETKIAAEDIKFSLGIFSSTFFNCD